jgi:hypothetical protein
MIKENEIIEYLNSCEHCYITVVENNQYITEKIWNKLVNRDTVMLNISNKNPLYDIEEKEQKISIVFWHKVKGYQIKGYILSDTDTEKRFKNQDDQINELRKRQFDKENFKLIICKIDELYHVTPGKCAGKPIN